MSKLNRREFAEALALAALVPMLGRLPGGSHLSAFTPAAGPAGLEPGTLAKALASAIRAQYGSRLSAADLTTITRQIQTGLERADTIRKATLANGDEPDFVFSAVRPGTSA